jgi:hypothetical protein
MNIRQQVSILVLALFSVSPVAAQKSTDWHSWPTGGRFGIAAGVFAPDLDTTIVVTDANDIIGTGISFENNLGLDDSESTVLVDMDWRFFKRHTVSYRYFDLARSSTTTGGGVTIKIGDETFDLTLPIQSFFDITTNEIAYSYSILFDEKKELFVGFGISLQDIELGIQGTESAPNPGEIINSQLDSTAPLPTLNFGFNYAFSDKWMFQSILGWLAVELDLGADEDLSGQIINANVGVVWQAFKNVGFFANYQVYDVDVDYKDNDVRFAVDYDYKGPVLGVTVNF